MLNKFVNVLTAIALLWGASGCSSLSPTFITQENLASIDRNNAYVIVGQKIVTNKVIKDKETNLTHMAMAMHINWDLIKPMKGIHLPQSSLPASIFQNGPYYEFLVANVQNHTYRTWIIPETKIGPDSRAIIFANMVASKDGFFIPFHSTLRPFNAGIAPLEKGKNTRALETFLANAFIIDKPGVYYLGEMAISGALEMSGGFSFEKERGGLLTWKADINSEIKEFEKYLAQQRLTHMPVYNLSNAWRELPMDELTGYKAGDKELTFQRVQ